MTFLTAETTDERDSLATFSQQQIDQVATALHGLDREQLAQAPSASAMSLGALARHVLLIASGAEQAINAAPDAPAPPDRSEDQLMAEGTIAPEALRGVSAISYQLSLAACPGHLEPDRLASILKAL